MALIALAGVPVGLVAWSYLATHDLVRSWRELQREREASWPPAAKRGSTSGPGHQVIELLGTATGLLRPLALAALLLAVVGLASRVHHRRRRARHTTRWELRLGRDDLANPYRVQEAFEGLVGAIAGRWYERLWRGCDHFALEIHRLPD
jgi:hypothetical protein